MALTYPEIIAATKSLSSKQEWTDLSNGKIEILHPLDIDGVTQEGLFLRGVALKDQPNLDVTLLLQCALSRRRGRAIERIDWRPFHKHRNHRGPPGHQFNWVRGTHRHSFELNWLNEEGRLRAGNLPVAEVVTPAPESYDDLLAFVAKHFRINGVQDIGLPPWEESLFSGLP